MVVQYPDILTFKTVTDSSTIIDENGDTVIIPGISVDINVKCRFEPNAEGDTIPTTDGQRLEYSWNVFAPLDQPDVPEWIEFTGTDKHGEQIAEGVVKRFKRGQMNLTINV